eukprot:SAG11_NODE_50335_length_114_cov_97.333333_1_plen_31_part_10
MTTDFLCIVTEIPEDPFDHIELMQKEVHHWM